jgi:toxin secretion/phage lysis holin
MWGLIWDNLLDVGRDLLVGWLGKGALSTVLAVAFGFLGGWDRLTSGLFVLMGVDFALGFTRAWIDSCVSLRRIRRGLAKFFLYAIAIFVASTLDSVLNFKAEGLLHFDFRAGIIIYLVINEMLSVMGHLRALGCPLPQAIFKRLADYRDCAVFTGKPGKGA